ncbi:MAG: 50S ribosomal protein L29 [Acidimicrobiia bacterium]|nr:50S ribosomal protein L29 [Acidimicrobiia bacterium]
MTQAAELRELHDEELENRLAEANQELFNLRFQHVTGQLDNYARLSEVRREVARVNTLLREREIAAAEAAEAEAAGGHVAPPTPEAQDAEKSKRRARVLASRRRAEAEQADKEPTDG